ncbi:protein FAM3C isoform X1 [Pseudorasbora parva]|uniref:protein FAM3C isoform X1 n=1 Tax=Pseudorasbora parva TaxID=51549 RepID=UPI00351E0051
MIYVRRVGPLMVHRRQRDTKKCKYVFMLAALIISVSLVLKLLEMNPELTASQLVVEEALSVQLKPDHKDDGPKSKCGLPEPCPGKDFAFKIHSGATNSVGPQICFDGKMIIKKDTRGNWLGINIAVINEKTGEHIKTGSFNMWTGSVEDLIEFLKSIEDGSLVLIATFDDPATKLNDEARALIAELGSSYISKIKFRDNWLFVGGKKTMTQVYFEQHMKNDKGTNKYENWPEMIEIEGCIPRVIE